MPDLPLVLCGPMVRRVSRNAASVFIALHRPRRVELVVYAQEVGGPGRELMRGTAATRALGPGLHVAVVTATRMAELTWGTKCLYSLTFRDEAGVVSALPLEGLLYARGPRLPGFQLPSSLPANLRVLHGSCRKPHGEGRDALHHADALIEDAIRSGEVWPQQLFMTGDQIYADDVHPELFVGAQRLGHLLVGPGEQAELVGAHGDDMKPGWRRALVQAAGLTSTEAACHLITLAEFIGMYLLIWSPALWEAAGLAHPVSDELRTFRAELPRVRRALAHLSTGMIFDDHDVTDDWNIRSRWVQAVEAHDLGRRIVRNALAAYAVFQHWGNDPEAMEGGAGEEVLAAVEHRGGAGAPPALDALLGGLPSQPQRLPWGWRWSDNPLYEVIALDCRTRRSYDGRGRFALVGAADVDRALAFPADGQKSSFSIVISPAPVLGVSLIEAVQKLASQWADEAVVQFDYEPWSAGDTINALLNRLLYRSPALVLSGDVHYGFVATAVAQAGPHKGGRIINCTASALKNCSPGLVRWGKTLGGVSPHAAGVDEVPAADWHTALSIGEGVTLLETVPGAGFDLTKGSGLVPQLDWSIRRAPIFAASNLAELRWLPAGKLQQTFHGDGRRPAEVMTFPLPVHP